MNDVKVELTRRKKIQLIHSDVSYLVSLVLLASSIIFELPILWTLGLLAYIIGNYFSREYYYTRGFLDSLEEVEKNGEN